MASQAPDKKKVTCFSCRTSYKLNLAKLPPDQTEVKCLKCGKAIPILDRVLPDKTGQAPDLNQAAPAAAAKNQHDTEKSDLDDLMAEQMMEGPGDDDGSEGEGWLAIYGDMMSLLLVFFVLLFAISSIDKVKFQTVMESVSNALGGKIVYTEADKAAAKASQTGMGVLDRLKQNARKEEMTLDNLEITLSNLVSQDNMQQKFGIKNEPNGLVLIGQDEAMFDSGKAEIKDGVKPFLIKVGNALKNANVAAVVEGHTDNVPIRTAQFPSNWELSVARATNVVRFLIDSCNIKPDRLSAAGYAFHRPRFVTTSLDNSKNRRIEIKIPKQFNDNLLRDLGQKTKS